MTIRHQGQQYRPRMAFLRKVSAVPSAGPSRDHLGEVPAGTWAGLGAGLVGWGASLVVLVIAVSQLPRPLMVHIGLRGPDCPEGVYTPHLSEKLPVTPVTPGGNLPRNAPGIAPSFPGSGPQPLRPLRRIRLPTGH